jgi:outer membrane assembly lipoprotein YfgL
MRLLFVAALALVITACAGPEKPKPAELGPNTALIGIRSVWTNKIGEVDFPLDAKVVGNAVFVAGSDGVVAGIDARTGSDNWRLALGTKLTAGVGSDGRTVAVVNQENELIAIDAGKEQWRQKLGSLTVTSPLVAGARVFVLSGDRSVAAFDAASGRKLWQQQRAGDSLVLGQSGVLMAIGDTLVVGLGGRLVGMNPQNGNTRWEATIATSRGTNEVERLVDLVAGVSREGDVVCARAYQSAVGCVDVALGRVVWTKSSAGAVGVHGDETTVFGTEADGKFIAWRRTDGEKLWVSDRLRNRTLSAPLRLGRSVVMGDETGTLHFLSRVDGSPMNRLTTDGSAIVAAPVVSGQTLIAVTMRGGIFGFRPE